MKKLGICFIGIPGVTDYFGGVRKEKVHPLIIAGFEEAKRSIPVTRN